MESLLLRDCCIVIIMAQSISSVPIPQKVFVKCWHLLRLSTPEHERQNCSNSREQLWDIPKRRESFTWHFPWVIRDEWVAGVIDDLWANWGEWGISRPRPKTRLSIPNNAFRARHGLNPRTTKSHNQSKTRKTKLKNLNKRGVLFHSFLNCIVAVTQISPGR